MYGINDIQYSVNAKHVRPDDPAETGFTFTEWRQRVRLLKALESLAADKPVMAVALDSGYDNASAFIALFRRVFGVTPGQYQASIR